MARLPAVRKPTSAGLLDVLRSQRSTFIMAAILLVLGFLLVYPVFLLLILSFNTAPEMFFGPREWGLGNWRVALDNGRIPKAVFNTFLVWGMTVGISLPASVAIAWVLARTRVPFSHTLEFLFWVAYVTPGGVIAWMLLLDPDTGFINLLWMQLPFIDGPLFDIFSVSGIVWVGLMGNGIALKVMLLTPAFRNMDAALEEAARVSGASNLRTAIRVTVPLMISPIALVLALQVLRIFQGFETELLLGVPIGFYVYSTLLYEQIRGNEPPLYGQATVLGSITFLVVAIIIPMQRWILMRRRYTTIGAGFKPGLIDLGPFKWPVVMGFVALHGLLTLVPVAALVLGSFMWRAGFFNVVTVFTLDQWRYVLADDLFNTAMRTTLLLAFTAGILSPLIFSMLAYILVRTRWRGRTTLDSLIWVSAALPGLLSSLGLLMVIIGTPGVSVLYGTIWILLIIVILQGNTSGVNISKAAIVQVGFEMEEAARVSGAGWLKAYFQIWLRLLMPTMILLGTLNFNIAAGTTASIILLASRSTITMSILTLEYAQLGLREAASVVNIIVGAIILTAALTARHYGLRLGVRHTMTGGQGAAKQASTKEAPAWQQA